MTMLLEPDDVTPDSEDKYNRTLLLWVAERYEDIVEMPLEREDITSNAPDTNGRTPLLRVAGKRCEDIVKMILDRRVPSPNCR